VKVAAQRALRVLEATGTSRNEGVEFFSFENERWADFSQL
jgi:hypothetical protein